MLRPLIILLVSSCTSQLVLASQPSDNQVFLAPIASHEAPPNAVHIVEDKIIAALKTHPDPVTALLLLQPELAADLAQPRLLQTFGDEEPKWMTEGDKLRLRRQGKKFVDITDHENFYAQEVNALVGKANTSKLTHQAYIRPLFPQISTQKMHDVLTHMTGFYNRYYASVHGAHSAGWLYNHISQIIATAPFGTHISLAYFTNPFPQPSIIARFEPRVQNFSQPVTILGAHQDSANYLFPLLPAPGADDDCSGTVSILEAFRVLAENGYIPKEGPLEFHWYAGEEGGLLGSQAVARYKREQKAPVGAMIQFDMTAFVARNSTPSIGFISSQADDALTEWSMKLSREYISIPTIVSELIGGGSDSFSFTKFGYPATFASEGVPWVSFSPYIHGVNDTMYTDNEVGVFSLDHMARFSELALAFAIEQSGWDDDDRQHHYA